MRKNITLIGMPSVGKSTVGVVLAKLTGMRFVDTDLIIQECGKTLPTLISEMGAEEFIAFEDEKLASLSFENTVIATGGSAVYGERAMEHLKSISTVVYLRLPACELEKRLGDFTERGVVTKGARSVQELYDEREHLYEKYADIVIDERGTIIDTARMIIEKI